METLVMVVGRVKFRKTEKLYSVHTVEQNSKENLYSLITKVFIY